MSNYVILKLEYITGLAEENVPPKAQQVEAYPANHPTLASARATLNEIAETYPATEIDYWGVDMLWVAFKWEVHLAQRTYNMTHVRSRVVFWIEEES